MGINENGRLLPVVVDTRPKPALVFSPHPVLMGKDREIIYSHLYQGESIGVYLLRVGIMQKLAHQPVVLTINGIEVPRKMWFHCYPKPNTLINLYAVAHGESNSEGDKNPIATIAIIALYIVATIFFGPGGTAGVSGLTAALAFTAVIVIGGIVINSVFPPPKIKKVEPDNFSAFALGGGSNRLRPNEPFAKIIGTFKIFPDFSAMPYSEYIGDDQIAYYLFDYGYNDVTLTSHKIGDTPIETYAGFEIQESGPDGRITLFPGNVDTLAGGPLVVGVEQILVSSFGAVGLAVDIAGTLFAADTKGRIEPNEVFVQIDYRPVGTFDWLPFWQGSSDILIRSTSRKPVRVSFPISVPDGQYEVRVKQTTTGDTRTTAVQQMNWAQLRTYQADVANYNGRKRIAIKIVASGQLNGSLEQFNSIVRAKCQVWHEDLKAFVVEESNNPAWWFLDAARGTFVGPRKVYGGGYPDEKIDIELLKQFSLWCISEGLTCNGVFSNQLSVYDLLSSIALAGRATLSWGTGKLGVIWDAPNLPVSAVFGMHNIIPGSFAISYAADQLADAIEGQFINPDLNWQQDFVRVRVPGQTEEANIRTVKLDLCTSRTQAAQTANLYAAQNAYRNRRYKWQTDWEGMPCARGDVVGLTHDMASLDYSGRVVEGGDATRIILPREVPLFSQGSFILLVRPNGTFDTHSVSAGTGTSSVLTFPTPLPDELNPYLDLDHVPYDWKWQYGPTPTPGKKVKIDSFKPVSERIVELSAVDELDIFYTAKDNPYTYVPPRPIFGGAPVITDLTLTPQGIQVGNGYLVRVTVTWRASGNYQFADVRSSLDGAPFVLDAQNTINNAVEIIVPDFSTLTVEVTGYSNLGRLGKNTKASVTSLINFAGISPPATPSRFTVEGPVLNWAANEEVDVIGYKIRFHYGNNISLQDASPLHDGLLSVTSFRPLAFPNGQITLMLVAVDTAGLESLVPAIIITDLGDPDTDNIFETVDFRVLGYPGTITNGIISIGTIIADDETSFYDVDLSKPKYGSVDTDSFYPSGFFKQLVYETDLFTFAAVLQGSKATLDFDIVGGTYTIEYRIVVSGPMYGAVDGDPFAGYKSDGSLPFYTEFFGTEPEYITWPGGVFVGSDQYQFRITVSQGPIQGVISQFKVILDVPDIEENLDNVTISSGGTRLILSEPFTVIENIQLTLESDGGTAVSAKYLDKDVPSGPLIKCFNAANAAVGGIVDVKVKGY